MLAAEHLASEAGAATGISLSFALIESTTHAATGFAMAQAATATLASASALTLARDVLQAMVWSNLWRSIGLATCLLASLALVIFALAAADQQPKEPVKEITGRVLDQKGKPIAGAEVWLPVTTIDRDDTTSHATTDAQGRYALKVPDAWQQTPQHQRVGIVWALAPGHQLATASAYKALEGEPKSVDLTLGPETDTAFLVLGPDGRPVARAVVEPFHFKTSMAYNFPPGPMLPELRAITDASGRAALPALPREGFMTVKISTGALGIQRMRLTDKAWEPAQRTIRLRATARVEGRVVADQPDRARGLKIYMSTAASADLGRGPIEGGAEVVTGDDGTFSVPAIATGSLDLGLTISPTLPVRPKLPESIVVRPGKVTRVEIPLKSAVKVRGIIRVKGPARPVPGASIHVHYGSGGQYDTVVSDREGRYETYALSGDVRMQVIVMPENFVQLGEPWSERYKVPADTREFDLPPIEVIPGRTIKGRLVWGKDRPVVSAQITGNAGNRRYGFGRTDETGEFTLTGVLPRLPLAYMAMIDDAEGWVETSILSENPLILRVGPATAPIKESVAISGTVRDPQGRPVGVAEVSLAMETGRQPADQPGSSVVTEKRSTLTTNASGRYLITLPAATATRFSAVAMPENHTLAGTAWITSDGKRPIMFEPITVTPLRTINDFRGLIAQNIAATNPAEAERLLNAMARHNSTTYAVKACVRMALVDLRRSRRLAETIDPDGLRAYALGKVAEAIAGSDPPAARRLLAESFRNFSKVAELGFGGIWGPKSAAPMAAALLPVVERVDPDRLGEYTERILSFRWFPRTLTDLTNTVPNTSSTESTRSGTALAALLVRYDRDLASSIARPII
jgi:Carboxypeptidase regulatory-like domain